MAKIQEEVLVIKVSKLLKDSEQEKTVLTEDVTASLEAVVTELAGAGALVEIQKA
jgi:putative transposon-encoded protein